MYINLNIDIYIFKEIGKGIYTFTGEGYRMMMIIPNDDELWILASVFSLTTSQLIVWKPTNQHTCFLVVSYQDLLQILLLDRKSNL